MYKRQLLLFAFHGYRYLNIFRKHLLEKSGEVTARTFGLCRIINAVSYTHLVRLIGHITKPELGCALITRDGQEFELKAQGWNPLKENKQ